MNRRRQTDKQLPRRVYKKHGAYYFLQPIKKDGKHTNKWIKLGRDLSTALLRYSELVEVTGPYNTMADLFERYRLEAIPRKAPSTQRLNHNCLTPLSLFFGEMRPQDVKPVHVYHYLDIRSKETPVAANREKALLSHVFTKAMEWGVVDGNPCRGVKRIPERPRDRCPSEEEVAGFLKHAPALLQVYVPVKVLTGLRQQDLLALRRDQLKDDGIHVKIKKSGKKIIIEWSETLRDAVDSALELKRPVFSLNVFCNRRGQEYTGDGFRSIWQRAMNKAVSKKSLLERFTEHDLRAKAATDADAGGLDAQALLGHLDSATTRRYLRSKLASRVKPTR